MAALFLGAYHASLYAIRRSQTSGLFQDRLQWAQRAYSWAPQAFDPLYTYTSALLQSGSSHLIKEALPKIETLHKNFPYVPVVLYQTAFARIQTGQLDQANTLLQQAIDNDPGFSEAKELKTAISKYLPHELNTH